nr:deoxyribonuclease-1-like 2 isoform X2 [Microcebus murinus]
MGKGARSPSIQLHRGGGTQHSWPLPGPGPQIPVPWCQSCFPTKSGQLVLRGDVPPAWTQHTHWTRLSESLLPPQPHPSARHGRDPGPAGRALGAGGCRGHCAAHRSLQHPELQRQQSVGLSLRQRHRTSEARERGRSFGAGPQLSRGDWLLITPHLPAPPQILAGYDITLVQEVRDPDLSAVSMLMEQINSVSEHEYSFVSSEPLGRDQYKEMYLFVYRKDKVSVVDTYQYPDPEDAFSREPFVVKFSAPGSAIRELVLIPLHSAPRHAVAEIDALYDVYLDVIDKWGTDDMLFLGDFNADCKYVRPHDWAAIRLRSSEVFKWLIPDSADTTVGNSDCAYDRIVVCGAQLRRSLKPQSAVVRNFQEEFGLDQTQALAISDHFPVEVTLKSH